MATKAGTIHIDRALTNFSLKYKNGGLIADQIMPPVAVIKESDSYFVYGRQDFRITEDVRADGAESQQVDSWKIDSTPTYRCREHALKDFVTDRMRKNADAPLAPDFDVTQNLTNMILLNKEKRVVDTIFVATAYATSGHTTQLAGDEQWNNAAFDTDSTEDAIEVRIDTAKEAVREDTGNDPNVIVIPAQVSKVVKRDPTVRDLVKHTHSDLLVNGDLPATLWNMKVLIPGSAYDSAEEGQTYSGSNMWGNHVLVAYVAPNALTPRTLTLGLQFVSQKFQTSKWRDAARKADFIEPCEILDEKVVCEYCGYFIEDVIG